MGEDNLNASLAHVVLCCVAGNGIGRYYHGKNYTHPGMHANLFIHGVLGFMNFQSGTLNVDVKQAYNISLKAARYLPLACLNADLHRENHGLSMLHLLSGLIPFVIALQGEKDNVKLGNLMIGANIISLCHYSFEHNKEWGWYTAGAGFLAYFLAGQQKSVLMMFPLGLALMEYCAYRVHRCHFETVPGQ